MEWSKGYSVKYYATLVDVRSWRDSEKFDIINGSINRKDGGLRESADIECRNFGFYGEKWVRIYMDTVQGGDSFHEAIFTGLAISPETNWNSNIVTRPFQCYSVLKPAEDVLLQRGWYAPAEMDGALMIRQLLSVTPAPVVIEGESPALSFNIVAENNETHLSMVNKILIAINWRIRILGDGTIVVCPKASSVSAIFDPNDNDSIEPSISLKNDWFSCPNVLRAVRGDMTSIARDDSEFSPLSTVNRGREVWVEESASQFNAGEDIGSYAIRRLKELQRVGLVVNYARRYRPNLLVSDWVQLHYPRQEIDGVFVVTSQKISLSHNGRTEEEVCWV